MSHRTLFLLLIAACCVAPATAANLAGDATAGKKLHDEKCVACHQARFGGDGSGMYTRKDRRVQSAEGLAKQVNGCNHQLNTQLSGAQIDNLVKYLNETFYKF